MTQQVVFASAFLYFNGLARLPWPHEQAFLALVDTYDTLVSGIPNFLICALAMLEIGYKPLGIRLDSGDLAYLSLEARKMFRMVEDQFGIPGAHMCSCMCVRAGALVYAWVRECVM